MNGPLCTLVQFVPFWFVHSKMFGSVYVQCYEDTIEFSLKNGLTAMLLIKIKSIT